MRRFFYQANFCAECGNALPVRRAWRQRYFCAVCAQQQRQHSWFYRLFIPGGLLLGTFGWAWASFIAPPATGPGHPRSSAAATVVTALDATAQTIPSAAPAPEPEIPTALCGARTRRGKPCRRLVPLGQRCAQHRGQPSLLPAPGTATTPK
jgi:hypothetical protein